MMSINTDISKLNRSSSVLKRQDLSSACKKSVSFDPSVKVYRTLHINDYTDKQVKATWYSPSEQSKMKSSAINIVRRMEQSTDRPRESDVFCTRGLEYFTVSGQERRKRRRQEAWDAVLRTQDLIVYKQENNLSSDDDCDDDYQQIIADVYAEYTIASQRVARVMGMADEHFVISLGFTVEDEKQLSSSSSSSSATKTHPTPIALLHSDCCGRTGGLTQRNYVSYAA
jgi:hypothetical protein